MTEYRICGNETAAGVVASSDEPVKFISALDGADGNDTFDTAVNIGDVSSGYFLDNAAISPSGDLDYYKFTLAEESFITIETDGVSGGDTILTLYDSGRSQLASNDDGGNGYYSKLSRVLSAGTYYIQVKAYGTGTVSRYSLAIAQSEKGEDVTLSGRYTAPQTAYGNVSVTSGTTVSAYFPGCVQVLYGNCTVTVGDNVSLSCSSIRNADILFGEDAYWGGFYDGVVTFTGRTATLSSKVANCITAAGIMGSNVTVNFSGDADNSGGISISVGQGNGPGNEGFGIGARESLTVNGSFGGTIEAQFDFSTLSSTRWAEMYGMGALNGALTVNGGISGLIAVSAWTNDTQYSWLQSRSYGLYAKNDLSVTGDISGTVAALAETNAYAVYAGGTVSITVSGTLFAGASAAGETVDAFLAKLSAPQENLEFLRTRSSGNYAIYGSRSGGTVTLTAGAEVWGKVASGTVTVSSEASIHGDVNAGMRFVLEQAADGYVIDGDMKFVSVTVDAAAAQNGRFALAKSVSGLNIGQLAVTDGKQTLYGRDIQAAGGVYSFVFQSGMTVVCDPADTELVVTVSGSSHSGGGDVTAPTLGADSYVAVSGNSVTVTWDAATDDTGVAGYEFRYGGSPELTGDGIDVAALRYTVSGLANGEYYYQIRAYDAAGNFSGWSAVKSFTVDYTAPVFVPYEVPRAEYMYGCTATVMGMLLGYYDTYGYEGYDVSNLIAGRVELDARGLDGNEYDMDAFDTVLGSAIASEEYVARFVNTTPEAEYPYTFVSGTTELNTGAWNCIADYLGTGQYWRGNGDLSTSVYYSTLASMQASSFTKRISSGSISVDVPARYCDALYGLDLYVRQAGYSLDAAATRVEETDNNGGTFTFADYKAEIDAGHLVAMSIQNHSILGYGYDASTNEIIFDDTYQHDCRMEWGGKYYYSGADREMLAAYVIRFDTEGLEKLASAPGDLNGDGRSDIVMTISQSGHPADGSTGAWLIQGDQTAAWGDLSQRNSGWSIFGTGFTAVGKETGDVYVKSADNVVGAWVTNDAGAVAGWETVGQFDATTNVLGLGDFNGDGQTDLLLHNDNGAVGCFFTSGSVTGWNYFQSLGDEWTVSAVGDLNGDGRDDVVLKHDAGFAGSWLTQSDYTMAWANLDTLAEGFAIVGCGDFDGDGTDDVLLQNGSYFGAWIVEDGSVSSWMGLGDLGSVSVEQIGDFDADGIDDLRVRTAAGDLGAQLVKGADTLDWKYYGSVGSEWSTGLAALK